MDNQSPFNAIPPVPLALVLLIAGVELVFSAAESGFVGGPSGIGWRAGAMQDYAFAPAVVEQVFGAGDFGVDMLRRFVSYIFIHYSFTHTLWACVLLLALGKFVGEAYRPVPFVILFFGSAIFGALVYGLFSPRNVGLVGAYPGIYGLIGAYTYMMWLTLGRMGENQYRAFTLIGILMGLMLVWSMIFGATPIWIAEATGFVIGLALAPLVAPGGWQQFLSRVRQR
ncbi:rhomboid family intramembrane serine protease [Salibaculum griseiflavum]|jgi:membrane associated rhomboid family serine protease|uniref:Rhomboid family intramembrane serine protease n=1 Tax=Salibaculum griseiflavum TaxID=1914409 RepID=A0A2V1P8V5_9RHOB|nr:rhomboid family intramembrane serine protease [Salibaculum griseiflavum]PWG17787.1 rhomboid family intramembrane serine protease [Salibaculum griseiflavum]